ncbi:MAG: 30S ribosomal protein S2 [bacterium]|nr:30S ribosomal protein S2 [bacterium]
MATQVDPVEDVKSETKAAEATIKQETKHVSVGVDIKELLSAGAHFGHKASRWHPAMAPYIHSKRNGSHIIDLTKTVERLEAALSFLTQNSAAGRQVLFVGTKRQAHDIVFKLAQDTAMPYVVERWAGGMLTNHNTIQGRIKHLKDLETKMESGELGNKYNKLEVQRFQEEIEQMNVLYGGIKDMHAKLGAVFVFDPTHDKNAVLEARKLNVPLIAICDTNSDPNLINFPIPCNDDAIKTLQLIADYVKHAVETGKAKSVKSEDKAEKAEVKSK